MRHQGVEYSLTQIELDLRKWQFRLGGRIRSGTTRTKLEPLAAKRVRKLIDHEQRARLARAGEMERKVRKIDG